MQGLSLNVSRSCQWYHRLDIFGTKLSDFVFQYIRYDLTKVLPGVSQFLGLSGGSFRPLHTQRSRVPDIDLNPQCLSPISGIHGLSDISSQLFSTLEKCRALKKPPAGLSWGREIRHFSQLPFLESKPVCYVEHQSPVKVLAVEWRLKSG